MRAPMVNVVILNWNGAQDTIECLESLRNLSGVNYRITVCDNASSDSSLYRIGMWADQHAIEYQKIEPGRYKANERTPLVLIDNGSNLGFAAGNNTGIAYALSQPDTDYVWLLNNDTVVEPDTLQQMVRRMEQDAGIGICGSVLRFYDDRSVIQAVGGCKFDKITGIASQTLGRYLPSNTVLDQARYENEMDYVCGASMLVSRDFLESVGLMEESYFLYYEEIDWAMRAKGKFKLAIAVNSIVYHKEGSSIGSASMNRPASPLSEFYLMRSKIRFARKHTLSFLPITYLTTVLQMLNRFRRGQWKVGRAVALALLDRKTFSAW